MKNNKILSIDVDYCRDSQDLLKIYNLFCSNLYRLSEDKVMCADYHIDILDLIKNIKGPLEVFNIDDHHDIYYDEHQIPVLRNSIADSSDWVAWLFIHRQVENYTWIGRELSEQFSQGMLEKIEEMYDKGPNYDVIDSRNILFNGKQALTEKMSDEFLKFKPRLTHDVYIQDYLYDIEFDYLFLCKSPDYTVKENYFMFDLLKLAKTTFFKNRNNEKKISEKND